MLICRPSIISCPLSHILLQSANTIRFSPMEAITTVSICPNRTLFDIFSHSYEIYARRYYFWNGSSTTRYFCGPMSRPLTMTTSRFLLECMLKWSINEIRRKIVLNEMHHFPSNLIFDERFRTNYHFEI